MTASEKVAYLKGLCEGMDIGDTKEGKLFKAVIDILDELTASLADVQDAVEDLADSMDELGEDVNELENDYYEHLCECEGCSCDEFCGCTDDCDNCPCEGDCEDCDCDDCCDYLGSDDEDDEEDEDGDEDIFYQVECPGCGFDLTIDESILAMGHFECPECGAVIDFDTANVEEVDFEDDDDEDDEED